MTEIERLRAENAEMKRLLTLAEKQIRKSNLEAGLWKHLHEREMRLRDRTNNGPLRARFASSQTDLEPRHKSHGSLKGAHIQ